MLACPACQPWQYLKTWLPLAEYVSKLGKNKICFLGCHFEFLSKYLFEKLAYVQNSLKCLLHHLYLELDSLTLSESQHWASLSPSHRVGSALLSFHWFTISLIELQEVIQLYWYILMWKNSVISGFLQTLADAAFYLSKPHASLCPCRYPTSFLRQNHPKV